MDGNKDLSDVYNLLFRSGRAARVINLITIYRIVTAPLLLLLVFTDRFDLFKWLLLASFLTDAVDGILARRYNVTSILGTKLDSVGDDLTIMVAIVGLFRIHVDFIKEELWIIGGLLGLFFIQILLSLWKYKNISCFHTYLAKAAALLQGIFLLSVFFFDQIIYPLFYTASLITFLELIEEIVLIFVIPRWKANVKGLYWVLKGKV